jgi:hypothetical protein
MPSMQRTQQSPVRARSRSNSSRKNSRDQRAQRAAERNAALHLPEPPAAFGGAHPLAEQVEDAAIADLLRQLAHQQQIVDRGVIGFDVAAQHQAVRRQRGEDPSHRPLAPPLPLMCMQCGEAGSTAANTSAKALVTR